VVYDIEVKVKSMKGTCDFGHKIGDTIKFDGKKIIGQICYSSLLMLLPDVYAMRHGAEFPWEKNDGVIEKVCPDPENPVIFEIKRIGK
jgi:uncharacterized repeat protein (TIGR04076 family)